MECGDSAGGSNVYVFNPLAEGYIAHGKAFTPVKHQAALAEDLANLPQFLCEPEDIVLLRKPPSASFLNSLAQAGFPTPEFVELKKGSIDTGGTLYQRKLGELRPWAWGPDSVALLKPLFGCVSSGARNVSSYFNDEIVRLYSKAWSAEFLNKVLARWRQSAQASEPASDTALSPNSESANQPSTCPRIECSASPWDSGSWLCSEQDVGVAVDKVKDALAAVDAIRSRGHHRVVVKEAHGLAGHNAIRLWERELSPAQRQWLGHVLEGGRQVVVEPWLERELDFSIQLEMMPGGLALCGYTGLSNDRKGQFLANWAEADHQRCLPAKVATLLGTGKGRVEQLYAEIIEMLAPELKKADFLGPVSIDAFVYRTPEGECRLKPIVEMNPRYTMGRLTVELMKHACPGTCGRFRLVTRAQARAEGFSDFSSYARSLGERAPLRLEGEPLPKIRQGAICLNDPGMAQVCLATFEVYYESHFQR